MTTTRIKEKISELVVSQLPEFIGSDYPTFVSFIEAYYRFIEQDQGAQELLQNARSYSDIDSTTSAFIQYFLKNYAQIIPTSVLADKKLLIKRIKNLYESNGSELSFKLLFRILFDTTVDLKYPYENVLRASDGRWNQEVSLRVSTDEGSISDIVNRYLFHSANGVDNNTPILKTKILTSTLTEIYLDHNYLSTYAVGDTVTVSDADGIIFSGTIEPTTTAYKVLNGGAGFKVGQIFNVNIGSGVGTQVKVTKITSDGGISALKFIAYGYGYTGTFDFYINSDGTIYLNAKAFADNTAGFVESGSVLRSLRAADSSSVRYFSEDYIEYVDGYGGTVIETFSNVTSYSTSTDASISGEYARVQFTLGALGRLPGSYISNKGFISDGEIALENDTLYQPFAYQTQTEVDVTKFYDIVKKLIHPAGQQLYNNRVVYADFDISSNVEVWTTANANTYLFTTVSISEEPAFSISKPVGTDTVSKSDSSYLTLTIPVIEAEDIRTSTVFAPETIRLSLTQGLTDTLDTIDDTDYNFSISRLLSDTATALEQLGQTFTKNVIDATVAVSGDTSNGSIQSQTFTSDTESYFASGADYVGEASYFM